MQRKEEQWTEKSTERHSPRLVLPWGRGTGSGTVDLGLGDQGSVTGTAVTDLEDRGTGTGTGTGTGGTGPKVQETGRFENHCCTSGPGPEPGVRLGCPGSRAGRQVSQIQTPLPAPDSSLRRSDEAEERVCSEASAAASE